MCLKIQKLRTCTYLCTNTVLKFVYYLLFLSLYEKKWKPIASLSCQRQQLCVCELNGNVYAIAGTDGTTRMSSVEMYSFEKDTWGMTPSLQVDNLHFQKYIPIRCRTTC